MLGRLVLELGHAAQFAEHGIAVQNPAQLGVLVHMGLDEQGVLLRIQAAGNVLSQLLQGTAAQICGSLADSNGVQVSHEIEALIQIRSCAPVLDGSEVVSDGEVSRGLNARENYFLIVFCHFIFSLRDLVKYSKIIQPFRRFVKEKMKYVRIVTAIFDSFAFFVS